MDVCGFPLILTGQLLMELTKLIFGHIISHASLWPLEIIIARPMFISLEHL
jgi:hypothetical protein